MNELVQTIHREFYSAPERLHKEVELLEKEVEEFKKNGELIEQIRNLGFTKSASTNEDGRGQKLLELREVLSNVEYYSLHYPNYKFITHAQVLEICKKYGFAANVASFYKGEIPVENMKNIAKAKIKARDEIRFRPVMTIGGQQGYESFWKLRMHLKAHIDDSYRDYPDVAIEVGGFKEVIVGRQGSPRKLLDAYHESMKRLKEKFGQLVIVAPIHDFSVETTTSYLNPSGSLSPHDVLQRYVMSDHISAGPVQEEDEALNTNVSVPDPVVLKRVRDIKDHSKMGGYLIFDAWGPEAEDPIVLNPKHN